MFRPSKLSLCVALSALLASSAIADDGVKVIYPSQDRQVAAALESPAAPTYEGLLHEVFSGIAKTKGIDVIIDEQAFEEAHIERDVMLTYDEEKHRSKVIYPKPGTGPIPLRDALDEMVRPYQLSYYVEDGILKVTSAARAYRKKVMRAYDVSSLLDSTTTTEDLAGGVSRIASSLEPEFDHRIAAGGRSQRLLVDSSRPVEVVPFKKTLVFVGGKLDQERVAKAIAILQDIEAK